MHISAVALGPHREVHPDGRAALLEDELVEVQFLAVGDVQQDTGIAYRLLLPRTVDIYCAPRQMVRVLGTSAFLIHLRRAVARVDPDALHILRGFVILARIQAIQEIIAEP